MSLKPFVPHPYQEKAVIHLLENPAAGLFLSPGLGKTAITLQAIRVLIAGGHVSKVLVMAPMRVCYSVWPREIEKWANFSGLRCVILHGPKKNEALLEDADIYLCNPEGMKWLASTHIWKKVDMLVIDESSQWRNRSSERWKLMVPKLKVFKRRVILTGTPTPNHLEQIWSQVYILDMGQRLERFVTRFRHKYFESRAFLGFQEWMPKRGAAEAIAEKISDIIMSANNDVLDLPPLVESKVEVELPKKVRGEYETLKNDCVLEGITAVNAGVLYGKLHQFASGAVYVHDGEERTWDVFHKEKMDAFREMLDEQQGQPLLVLYNYQHELARLREVREAPVIGKGTTALASDKIAEQWNRDELEVLYLHPQSGGHGLNLQESSCRAMFWSSPTVDAELYVQATSRIHRQGVKSSVVVHECIAKDTIDEDAVRSRGKKNAVESALRKHLE